MWYAVTRRKRALPTRFLDYFPHYEMDLGVPQLLAEEYEVRIADNPTIVFCHQFGEEYKKYRCPRVFNAGEPWAFNKLDYDFRITFDYEESDVDIRFPLYGFMFPNTTLCNCIGENEAEAVLRQKIRFCDFVYSNHGATDRQNFVEKLCRYKPVECPGAVKHNTNFYVSGTHSSIQRVTYTSGSKFSLAFENCRKEGYTTEKIATVFAARSVPIYYGNPEVYRDFNPGSFINVHDFDSFDAAIEYIKFVDNHDDLYRQMLCTPCFRDNKPTPYVDTRRLLSKLIAWMEAHRVSFDVRDSLPQNTGN